MSIRPHHFHYIVGVLIVTFAVYLLAAGQFIGAAFLMGGAAVAVLTAKLVRSGIFE
jgi:hypothetical protein